MIRPTWHDQYWQPHRAIPGFQVDAAPPVPDAKRRLSLWRRLSDWWVKCLDGGIF